MARKEAGVPVKTSKRMAEPSPALQMWRPLETLRREIDRLFEEFDGGFWHHPFRRPAFDMEPLWRRELTRGGAPAVDVTEKDDAYQIAAELPGMDEKDIEVTLSNGTLTIKGEKQEEKEEKKKDYYLHERHFGSFQRSFAVPEGVDPAKIAASFRKGVLTVTLPKKAEARKPKRTVKVKAG